MLPFFNGERTPDLPRARASLHGMDPGNFTAAHAYRAAMEGATYALRNGFDALRSAGLTFDAIRLTGGGAHSAAWRQMVADIFALPVEVPREAEGAAFGAALQAHWACHTDGSPGALADLARAHVRLEPQLGTRPDAASSAAYEAAYQKFRRHLHTATLLHRTAQDPA
jgi:xylulokinase